RLTGQSIQQSDMLPAVGELNHMPPCHRTPKAEADQEDDGGKTDGNGLATVLATANPMNGKGDQPPVAGWQAFRAPIEEDLGMPDSLRRCAHCGAGPEPGNPVNNVVAPGGEKLVPVHRNCAESWMKIELEGQ